MAKQKKDKPEEAKEEEVEKGEVEEEEAKTEPTEEETPKEPAETETETEEPETEEEPAEEEPDEESDEEETVEESTEESTEEPDEEPTVVVEDGMGKKKYILIGLIVIAGLAIIGGGIFVYRRAMSKKEAAPGVTPSPSPELTTPTETPEASPTAELKREDLKLQVLNGSGVVGAAGEAEELLEGLGYEDIETGNADSYDYEETEVSIKEDKEDYSKMLTDDLSEKYTLAAETKALDEESEFDAVVIIGTK